MLSICQELDGKSPGVLKSILEVDKAVTHMSSHGTFPTYGDRASITVEMQYLEEKNLYHCLVKTKAKKKSDRKKQII